MENITIDVGRLKGVDGVDIGKFVDELAKEFQDRHDVEIGVRKFVCPDLPDLPEDAFEVLASTGPERKQNRFMRYWNNIFHVDTPWYRVLWNTISPPKFPDERKAMRRREIKDPKKFDHPRNQK